MARFHGPLLRWLLEETGFPQPEVVDWLQQGFHYVGQMPPYGVAANRKTGWKFPMTVDELWNKRQEINAGILDTLTESEFAEDLREATMKDCASGAMTEPRPWTPADLDTMLVSRRFAVRAWRANDDSLGNLVEYARASCGPSGREWQQLYRG